MVCKKEYIKKSILNFTPIHVNTNNLEMSFILCDFS